MQSELAYEPKAALDGGADGLFFYNVIANKWKSALKSGGKLCLEIGEDQGNAVSDILADTGFKNIEVKKDIYQNNRMVFAENNSATAARKAVFYMNNLSISILGDIFKGNYIYAIITIVARMFVVFCCLPVHELAHGWAAYKQGDDTAKNSAGFPLIHFRILTRSARL